MITHYFTFGQDHMTSFPLPEGGGKLADYWVEVTLPDDYPKTHREVFLLEFTSCYCPNRTQFGFEYTEQTFNPDYFPKGRLTTIKVD